MKKYVTSIMFIVLSIALYGQPWKLTKDFSLAFQDNYDSYRLLKKSQGNRAYCIGFDKVDTSKRIFEFETLGNKKDGWFIRIDPANKEGYRIFFENGTAKRISYTAVDSSVSTFSLDNNLLNGVHIIYYANGNIKEYGFYRNNARFGEWRFYNVNGKVISEGHFGGDYKKLEYNTAEGKLITLNRYLDTVKTELFTQKKYDSLKKSLNQEWGMIFPVNLHFKVGSWKYYDDTGKLIRQEFYEDGKLVRTEKKLQ